MRKKQFDWIYGTIPTLDELAEIQEPLPRKLVSYGWEFKRQKLRKPRKPRVRKNKIVRLQGIQRRAYNILRKSGFDATEARRRALLL